MNAIPKARLAAAVLVCFSALLPVGAVESGGIFEAAFGPAETARIVPARSLRPADGFFAAPLPIYPAADAVTGASKGKEEGGTVFGFPDKLSFHKFAGWTSGALLLAAGVVGAVRAYTLMSDGHDYRNSLGVDEDEALDLYASDKISSLWREADGQVLRWTHVGLLVAGETLYLSNAVTGIGMFSSDEPGLNRADIHRYAFFAHAAMMLAEAILGVMTTEALRRGDHEAISETLGPAHVALGFAIPATIFAAGTLVETGWLASDR